MKTYDLDPEYCRFIDQYLEVSALLMASDIKQLRIDYELLVNRFRYPHPPGITTSDATVSGGHGPIPVRRYQYQKGNQNLLILFIHGGGFILGSLDSHGMSGG